jgi:CRISPR-associated protein Cas5d
MAKESFLDVKVWGDFALFTRPEFSAERVSYDIMTPSAGRGVLEAIFWKPEFTWRIHEIHVLKEIRHFSILRNECNTHQSDRAAKSWEKSGVGGYYADEDRSQRHSLCLRNVAYLIKAEIVLKPHETNIVKYRDQFRRRLDKGQCHHQPYLGTREFSAFFSPPDQDKAIEHSDDLGLMLFDVEITEDAKGNLTYSTHDSNGSRVANGKARPKFFHAELKQGVLNVPTRLYDVGVYQCS